MQTNLRKSRRPNKRGCCQVTSLKGAEKAWQLQMGECKWSIPRTERASSRLLHARAAPWYTPGLLNDALERVGEHWTLVTGKQKTACSKQGNKTALR
jgi:hypothetical protein